VLHAEQKNAQATDDGGHHFRNLADAHENRSEGKSPVALASDEDSVKKAHYNPDPFRHKQGRAQCDSRGKMSARAT
jgi:hypothetical protein